MTHDCFLVDLDNQVLLDPNIKREVKMIYAIGSSLLCACALDKNLTISTSLLFDQMKKMSMDTFITMVKNVSEGCHVNEDDNQGSGTPM